MRDWENIRAFGAVARLGSLSAAAREMGVEHSTVSRRLDALEHDLGLTLLHRSRNGCRLTAAGQSLALLAADFEKTGHAIDRLARAAADKIEGEVHVTAPPLFASELLAQEFASLRRTFPQLEIRLTGESRLAVLGRQEADVAVRMAPPEEASAIGRKVGRVAFRAYAQSSWLSRTAPDERSLVAFDRDLEDAPQEHELRRLFPNLPVAFRANGGLILQAAVKAGLGIGMLPMFTAAREPELELAAPAAPPIHRDLWILVHPDLRNAPAVKVVADHLASRLGVLFGRKAAEKARGA